MNELASSKLGGGDASASDAADATSTGNAPTRKLRQGIVSMSSALDETSEHEADANRYLWGTDSGVAAYTNEQRDAHTSKQSAKDKRKAKQELEKSRKEYEAKVRAMDEAEAKDAANGAAVSNMVLPDYTSGRNEKDIHCRNVSLALDSGRTLLDNGEIKFAHGRRYGLVGKVVSCMIGCYFVTSPFPSSYLICPMPTLLSEKSVYSKNAKGSSTYMYAVATLILVLLVHSLRHISPKPRHIE